MTMADYAISATENFSQWDTFVDCSPQGTVFSLSEFLSAIGRDFELMLVCKGNEIRGGCAILRLDDGQTCGADSLVIYNGLMFVNDPRQRFTAARHERFVITEMFVNELTERFSKIHFRLSPACDDIRPFLWHNYHDSNPANKFSVNVRYTSFLDISELASNKPEEDLSLFRNLVAVRRQNIRKARRAGATVEMGRDIELFLSYHRQLLLSQGVIMPAETTQRIGNLIDSLLRTGQGWMFLAKDSLKRVLYVTVFAADAKRAYYLFGAGNPKATTGYGGTIAFWDAFGLLAREHGVREVDLEGVNSPDRGWFKLSFGGTLTPYYALRLDATGDVRAAA